ncbi:MAG: YiiD C-terminal domain-containing protein [Acidobacteriota bacterium]|nr:YiiD C-terminal domain-containing protein [Acidobacteriota bacterium]
MLDINSILPAEAMGIGRQSDKPGHLLLPLAPNINDKGTAFAGSIFSLAVLSGYEIALERSNQLNLSGNLFLLSSHITYHQSGLSDLIAQGRILDDLKPTRKSNWKMRIEVEVMEAQSQSLCATFEGLYVLQVENEFNNQPEPDKSEVV